MMDIIVNYPDSPKDPSSEYHVRCSVVETRPDPRRYKTYAYDNFKKSQPLANGHDMKYAVIAPSMLYLLYPLDGKVEGYSKDQFVEDLVNEVSEPRYLVSGSSLDDLTDRLMR